MSRLETFEMTLV